MSITPFAATETVATGLDSIGTPTLWALTIAAVIGLLALDFLATRKPHEVSMREAALWSLFYISLPVAFGVWVLKAHGSEIGVGYYTGYIVEKSLSVDNLFVFMLLLSAFAVPKALQQRVLLFGIIGALVLRGIFIALGAAALSAFTFVFLIFGVILLATGAKLLKDALSGEAEEEPDPNDMRVVKVLRRFWPVTEDYRGTRMTVKQAGRRALTPLALVTVAVFMTDIVFAVDSVPAVYGITADPYLVFATNAFALLGLRALYFVIEGLLAKLVHLSYGLSVILGFIGVKLVLHWAQTQWDGVPGIGNRTSLAVVVGVLAVTTVTSLIAVRREERAAAQAGATDGDELPTH
ncbi:TerC family integral membrane protein [Nocardioides aromaticivorans]|uniref:TerC family integral membrane protein n=1 Tax=Nocardioides aromaticivorans TaxID=200618 RepID=A0A7Z0CLQ0_9ACTN|nr:TerC/Alx family metal homeostasis membrane protein [Nocardioides aromaticivorans]NYI45509.1 TerC family integral membrane protein [Nocardioides aromaticivorans]